MTERHNVVRKWKTDFPEGLAPHLYEVEGGKYAWVFVNTVQTDEHVRIATLYDGPVFTAEQLLDNEKTHSPDTYQMACEFFAAIDDEAILPYWQHDIAYEIKCECGSESTYGPNATHSDYCPKYVKP
jgi:hypothetical protein